MLKGGRILAAKRELLKALSALPSDVEFNVIVFNTRVSAWRNRLMPANEDNKQNAAYFVEGQNLGNGTASYDALETAINLDAEAIYFVTDGEPYGGKITNPAEIVLAITRLNQFRRTTIHTFGIGIQPGKLEEVFKPFVSTKGSKGTGLGLAVTRKILHEHGGDIRVESQPGKGSKFVLRLPAQFPRSPDAHLTLRKTMLTEAPPGEE